MAGKTIAGRVLRFGQNDQHRICRPSYTQDDPHSYKHRAGMRLEKNFFVKSGGFYKADN